MHSLLVTDDHLLFRDTLQAGILGSMVDCQVHKADSLAAALTLVNQHPTLDLTLLDLSLAGITLVA